jgi:hypothetical protein
MKKIQKEIMNKNILPCSIAYDRLFRIAIPLTVAPVGGGPRGRPMRVGCRDCLHNAPGIRAVTIGLQIHQCMGDQSYAVFVWSTLNATHAEHLTLACSGSHKRVKDDTFIMKLQV